MSKSDLKFHAISKGDNYTDITRSGRIVGRLFRTELGQYKAVGEDCAGERFCISPQWGRKNVCEAFRNRYWQKTQKELIDSEE